MALGGWVLSSLLCSLLWSTSSTLISQTGQQVLVLIRMAPLLYTFASESVTQPVMVLSSANILSSALQSWVDNGGARSPVEHRGRRWLMVPSWTVQGLPVRKSRIQQHKELMEEWEEPNVLCEECPLDGRTTTPSFEMITFPHRLPDKWWNYTFWWYTGFYREWCWMNCIALACVCAAF